MTQFVDRLKRLSNQLAELADEISGEIEPLPAEILARFKQFEREKKCLACEEPFTAERREGSRGCHDSCYHTLYGRVRRGEETTMKLLLSGRWGPGGKAGRPARVFPELATAGSSKGRKPPRAKMTPKQRREEKLRRDAEKLKGETSDEKKKPPEEEGEKE